MSFINDSNEKYFIGEVRIGTMFAIACRAERIHDVICVLHAMIDN